MPLPFGICTHPKAVLSPAQTKVVADATASFSTDSITVPTKGTIYFEVTITAPASLPGAPDMLAL